MNIKFVVIAVITTCLGLSSCSPKDKMTVEKEDIDVTKIREVVIDENNKVHIPIRVDVPLLEEMSQSPIDIILIETIDKYGEIIRTPLKFTEHGLIKGDKLIMAPIVVNSSAGFKALGISSTLTTSGKRVTLTKGEIELNFDSESLTCFKNSEPIALLTDIPFYNNGTLYIPFETVLIGFEIEFYTEENMLIIGSERSYKE